MIAIPAYIELIIVAGSAAIAIAVWGTLSMAARKSGLSGPEARRVGIGAALFLGVWLGAALLLAPDPSSLVARDAFYLTPLIPLFAGLSMVAVLIALWRSSSLRRALAAVPTPTLHALQVWRVVGILFVILFGLGQLPAHFALPAGWGDIFVGVTAPLIALALARGMRGAAPLAIAWNVFGLLDLVVAVGMGTGFLAPLLEPELGPRVPPAAAMGVYPMILVPVFAVPLSMLLHVIALPRVVREMRVGQRLLPKAAH
jgi:hypothetical protein